jgi:hypothetical protein
MGLDYHLPVYNNNAVGNHAYSSDDLVHGNQRKVEIYNGGMPGVQRTLLVSTCSKTP